MKKAINVLIVIYLFLILSSCSLVPTSPNNIIKCAKLTADQQEIVDLISASNSLEILLFEFNTEEMYRNLEFWVEVYENGELVEHPAGLETFHDGSEKRNGRLAAVINQNPNYQWSLSVIENGGRSSHVSTVEITVDESLFHVYGPIDDSVFIEDGKEIILYKSLFTNKGSIAAYDNQTLQERPELLNEYLNAHLIKCRFNR